MGRVMVMAPEELPLRRLVDAIVADDEPEFTALIHASPNAATAAFFLGATRQEPGANHLFLKEIGYVIYAGDTALHIAAASYRCRMAEALVRAGANVRARNRRGSEPLHAAAVGSPGSHRWDPAGQVATIEWLVEHGADPNAQNMDGATPLHRAVRTRCAEAVRALMKLGANPAICNKSGSTPLKLALHNTGRPGSGSPEAKAQQQEILRLLNAG
ncbi:MAG: ankyrin repeat domain-containing protein [Armatimonadetes bacterium]|nr:ankyrin repeat domain-containing protein [Armatimonadota bacterium]MDE2205600.1 ankyrin repeat domain-containing protein [Armatimonadota bacterium]